MGATDLSMGSLRIIDNPDVFVIPEHRGHGYAKILMDSLMHDVQLSEITKWVLVTTDAHKLYEKYGFKQLEHPERYMEYFPKSLIK